MKEHFDRLALGDDAKLSIRVYRHGSIEAHTHDFLEMAYIIEGSALHTVGGTTMQVGPGNYFIIDYECQHQYDLPNGQEIVLYNILFQPGFIDGVLASCESFQQLLEHYLIHFRNAPVHYPQNTMFYDEDGSVLEKIRAMEREYNCRMPGYAEIIRCELIEIIVGSLRKITPEGAAAAQHSCVRAILEQISQNYMEPLTLTKISRKLNYSLPYLSRLFREETGMSFSQYLQKKRVENSCRLLLNTNKRVSEIAEMVGYTDLKSFQSIFKKLMHTTPKAYQKQNHE